MAFIDDVKIDPNELDVQWVALPTLALQYGDDIAHATRKRNSIKTELDVLQAELDGKLRKSLDKVTEAAVKNAIIQDLSYQARQAELHAAQFQLDILQSALSALMVKKTALDNMTRLYLAGYYGSGLPDVGREAMVVGAQKLKDEQVKGLSNSPRLAKRAKVKQ